MCKNINSLNSYFTNKSPEELLIFFLKEYKNRIALASSFGLEDQVLTDMIVKIDSDTAIFSIDTGRLFPETYFLIDNTNRMYNLNISIFFPENNAVEAYIKQNGINGFYDSVEKRKECCKVRKIGPLLRALSNLTVWICGLRRIQTITRRDIQMVEWDSVNKLIKINPLVYWTEKEVWNYIKDNKVPYNVLHKKGFLSIGCQPCTRAVAKNGNIRSGRWWWENFNHKECGLHK
ncbi:MAG: phosphoadenylyl-sulfate reductase [Bacteroidales bacterium OttesenSCG-928-I14]|jgi:phosphoadenosine phosphosulfate reductase|nr:phosphoadenylyl-sulfate reductase [Bacteroidales bacterium OttesenSCG-928-I14]